MESREEVRAAFDAYVDRENERERQDAARIRAVLAKHDLYTDDSNASSHHLSAEELEAVGRFLVNRTSVGKLKAIAKDYLEWVDSLKRT